MGLKPLLSAALVALSLGLVACGSGGSDSSSDALHGTLERID